MRDRFARTAARAALFLSLAVTGSILWLAGRGVTEPRYVPASAPTEIVCEPTEAGFVRVVILRSSEGAPCIDELEVYGDDPARNLAQARDGATATASSCLAGHASHRVSHLNDGLYGNARSWIAATESPGEWAQVALPGTARVARVVVSRDRRGEFSDRVPLWVDVMASPDGEAWTKIGELRGEPAPAGWTAAGWSVAFRQEHARHVRLSILGTAAAAPPSLDEVHVYGKEPDVDLAGARAGGAVFVSSEANASPGPAPCPALQDGSLERGWSAAQEDRQWVRIDLADRVEVSRLVFARNHGSSQASAPTAFTVDISLDGRRWKTVAREGWGLVAPPPPPDATTTSELRTPRRDAYGYANLALNEPTTATASGVIRGFDAIHAVRHVNDGLYGNDHSWVADSDPSWIELDLGAAHWVYRVAFGSDRSGKYRDRVPTRWRILAQPTQTSHAGQPAWRAVAQSEGPPSADGRVERAFTPVKTRRLRLQVEASRDGSSRVDELEVYGSPAPITATGVGPLAAWPTERRTERDEDLDDAFLTEEHAWLKTYGRADLDANLTEYVRVWRYPDHRPDDDLPMPAADRPPALDGVLDDPCWAVASAGVARVATLDDPASGPLVEQTARVCTVGKDLYIAIEWDRLLSSHVAIVSAGDWSGCAALRLTSNGLVLTRYGLGPDGRASPIQTTPIEGVVRRDRRCLEARVPMALVPRAAVYGLRIGLGLGGRHTPALGRAVVFRGCPLGIAQTGPCRNGRFRVRLAACGEAVSLRTETDAGWSESIGLAAGESRTIEVPATPGPIGNERDLVLVTGDGRRWRVGLFEYDPLKRALDLMRPMIERLARQGVDVTSARRAHAAGVRALAMDLSDRSARAAFLSARMAKRRLFLSAPDMAGAERILCSRRHAYEPSHNYSDLFDATGGMGGSVAIVEIPRVGDRLAPESARVRTLFDASRGIVRDPAAAFDLSKVYFAWKDKPDGHFRLMSVDPRPGRATGASPLTSGPFHDVYPTPLPDGGLAFISTRCRGRYLCWRPQAYVLFRMDPRGHQAGPITPLSYANLSEWAPSVTRDGRILWTRSEYQDKGADFSHTLWTVRPDGSHADLVFGNTLIQPNGYAGAHEVPGTDEVICTLISHFGDLNGPLTLIDRGRGRFDPGAIRTLTPEVPWPGIWPGEECFRDPAPISRDYFLCSHAPRRKFAIYALDRYGNREVLFADPGISVMCPTPFARRSKPPSLAPAVRPDVADGEVVVSDVYEGLGPSVRRGSVKWIRISQEVRADLERTPRGYRDDHPDFQDWYATPVHLVSGPYGWPSFVAKTSWGLAPVAPDGSARFRVPAGKVLYFSVLDGDYNEIQRMRSVVQLAPGERRGCVGCHEPRSQAPRAGARPRRLAASAVRASAWDRRPFDYERDVQPVLTKRCAGCHNARHPLGLDLRADRADDLVPASYRTLIGAGLVHYCDWSWNPGGNEKLDPLTFGTLRSKLWRTLAPGHHGVRLTADEALRIKTWTDLNCPLWPDYRHRPDRAASRR